MKKQFKKYITDYFNFLLKKFDFHFDGFEFDKDYIFLYIAKFTNNTTSINISFDEREGYLSIQLYNKILPDKKVSLDQIIHVTDGLNTVKLEINDNKIEYYKKIFGKYGGTGNELINNVARFIANEKDLEYMMRAYANIIHKYCQEILKGNFEGIFAKAAKISFV